MVEEALRQLDQLEYVFHELDHGLPDLAKLSDTSAHRAPARHVLDPARHVLDKPSVQALATRSLSSFDFAHYVFARQFTLLQWLNRSAALTDRTSSFIRFAASLGDRQVRQGAVSQVVVDEWLYAAIMDLTKLCRLTGSLLDASRPGAFAVLGDLLLTARYRLDRIIASTGATGWGISSDLSPDPPSKAHSESAWQLAHAMQSPVRRVISA